MQKITNTRKNNQINPSNLVVAIAVKLCCSYITVFDYLILANVVSKSVFFKCNDDLTACHEKTAFPINIYSIIQEWQKYKL